MGRTTTKMIPFLAKVLFSEARLCRFTQLFSKFIYNIICTSLSPTVRHSNMRLIDAKMVPWETSRWVSLQVTDAVKRITRGRRNAGFEVHVRDMEENVIDAKTVIDPTVCTSVEGKILLLF